MTISMEEEIKRYISNRKKVLHEVSEFRNELELNLEKTMADIEGDVQNTLYRTSNEPKIKTVFTSELTELDENRFYIALSTALFDYASGRHEENISKIFHGTREEQIGRTSDKLLEGFRQGRFDWGAKYESEDNSILLNELPEKVLPAKKNIPPILAFLWNGVNSSVDVGVERNHGWKLLDIEVRTAHEMTHAYNTVKSHPLENGRTTAVDEAAAMAVSYAYTGNMSQAGYEDRGLDSGKLETARKIFKELVDRQKKRSEAVSLTREKSVQAIKLLEKNHVSIPEAFRKLPSPGDERSNNKTRVN